MHEHVFVVNPEIAANFATVWDENAGVTDAIRRLDALHAAGVTTGVERVLRAFAADVREQVAPNWHHLHITRTSSRRCGRTASPTTTSTSCWVDNPRRIFSVTGAY